MHLFPNGKIYVGVTGQKPKHRFGNGFHAYGWNKKMVSDIEKYGWANVKHIILFSGLSKEDADKKEIEIIKEAKSHLPNIGYNVSMGGGSTGRLSLEQRKKISMIQMGRKRPEGFGKFIAEVHRGNKYRQGDVLSQATKDKMSQSHINNPKLSKKIEQRDLNGVLIKVWPSISEAERQTGFSNSAIVCCLKGKSKTSYGFKWYYHENK